MFVKEIKDQIKTVETEQERQRAAQHVCCKVTCSRTRHRLGGLFGSYQETCDGHTTTNFTPRYLSLKLVKGQKFYPNAPLPHLRIDPNEKSCADAGRKRTGQTMFDNEVQLLCKPQCGWDEKQRPVQLESLENA